MNLGDQQLFTLGDPLLILQVSEGHLSDLLHVVRRVCLPSSVCGLNSESAVLHSLFSAKRTGGEVCIFGVREANP